MNNRGRRGNLPPYGQRGDDRQDRGQRAEDQQARGQQRPEDRQAEAPRQMPARPVFNRNAPAWHPPPPRFASSQQNYQITPGYHTGEYESQYMQMPQGQPQYETRPIRGQPMQVAPDMRAPPGQPIQVVQPMDYASEEQYQEEEQWEDWPEEQEYQPMMQMPQGQMQSSYGQQGHFGQTMPTYYQPRMQMQPMQGSQVSQFAPPMPGMRPMQVPPMIPFPMRERRESAQPQPLTLGIFGLPQPTAAPRRAVQQEHPQSPVVTPTLIRALQPQPPLAEEGHQVRIDEAPVQAQVQARVQQSPIEQAEEIRHEAVHQEIPKTKPEETKMKTPVKEPATCQLCDGKGHSAKECNKVPPKSPEKPAKCQLCEQEGHTAKDCSQLRKQAMKLAQEMQASSRSRTITPIGPPDVASTPMPPLHGTPSAGFANQGFDVSAAKRRHVTPPEGSRGAKHQYRDDRPDRRESRERDTGRYQGSRGGQWQGNRDVRSYGSRWQGDRGTEGDRGTAKDEGTRMTGREKYRAREGISPDRSSTEKSKKSEEKERPKPGSKPPYHCRDEDKFRKDKKDDSEGGGAAAAVTAAAPVQSSSKETKKDSKTTETKKSDSKESAKETPKSQPRPAEGETPEKLLGERWAPAHYFVVKSRETFPYGIDEAAPMYLITYTNSRCAIGVFHGERRIVGNPHPMMIQFGHQDMNNRYDRIGWDVHYGDVMRVDSICTLSNPITGAVRNHQAPSSDVNRYVVDTGKKGRKKLKIYPAALAHNYAKIHDGLEPESYWNILGIVLDVQVEKRGKGFVWEATILRPHLEGTESLWNHQIGLGIDKPNDANYYKFRFVRTDYVQLDAKKFGQFGDMVVPISHYGELPLLTKDYNHTMVTHDLSDKMTEFVNSNAMRWYTEGESPLAWSIYMHIMSQVGICVRKFMEHFEREPYRKAKVKIYNKYSLPKTTWIYLDCRELKWESKEIVKKKVQKNRYILIHQEFPDLPQENMFLARIVEIERTEGLPVRLRIRLIRRADRQALSDEDISEWENLNADRINLFMTPVGRMDTDPILSLMNAWYTHGILPSFHEERDIILRVMSGQMTQVAPIWEVFFQEQNFPIVQSKPKIEEAHRSLESTFMQMSHNATSVNVDNLLTEHKKKDHFLKEVLLETIRVDLGKVRDRMRRAFPTIYNPDMKMALEYKILDDLSANIEIRLKLLYPKWTIGFRDKELKFYRKQKAFIRTKRDKESDLQIGNRAHYKISTLPGTSDNSARIYTDAKRRMKKVEVIDIHGRPTGEFELPNENILAEYGFDPIQFEGHLEWEDRSPILVTRPESPGISREARQRMEEINRLPVDEAATAAVRQMMGFGPRTPPEEVGPSQERGKLVIADGSTEVSPAKAMPIEQSTQEAAALENIEEEVVRTPRLACGTQGPPESPRTEVVPGSGHLKTRAPVNLFFPDQRAIENRFKLGIPNWGEFEMMWENVKRIRDDESLMNEAKQIMARVVYDKIPIVGVTGPPASGKTEILAETVYEILYKADSWNSKFDNVLITTESNDSLTQIVKKLWQLHQDNKLPDDEEEMPDDDRFPCFLVLRSTALRKSTDFVLQDQSFKWSIEGHLEKLANQAYVVSEETREEAGNLAKVIASGQYKTEDMTLAINMVVRYNKRLGCILGTNMLIAKETQLHPWANRWFVDDANVVLHFDAITLMTSFTAVKQFVFFGCPDTMKPYANPHLSGNAGPLFNGAYRDSVLGYFRARHSTLMMQSPKKNMRSVRSIANLLQRVFPEMGGFSPSNQVVGRIGSLPMAKKDFPVLLLAEAPKYEGLVNDQGIRPIVYNQYHSLKAIIKYLLKDSTDLEVTVHCTTLDEATTLREWISKQFTWDELVEFKSFAVRSMLAAHGNETDVIILMTGGQTVETHGRSPLRKNDLVLNTLTRARQMVIVIGHLALLETGLSDDFLIKRFLQTANRETPVLDMTSYTHMLQRLHDDPTLLGYMDEDEVLHDHRRRTFLYVPSQQEDVRFNWAVPKWQQRIKWQH